MFPEVPFPPEPVRTRWGSVLNAIEFYAKYFDCFVKFINELNSKDSSAIQTLQEMISKHESKLKCDIAYIYANYTCLSKLIKQLESQDMLLFDSLDLLMSAFEEIKHLKGAESQRIHEKFKYVLNKNNGLKQMQQISCILTSGNQNIDLDLSPQEIAAFKRTPIT